MTSQNFPDDEPREDYDDDFDSGPPRPFEDPPDEDDLWPGAIDEDEPRGTGS